MRYLVRFFGFLAAAAGFSLPALADSSAAAGGKGESYYFAFDESALRRDIARIKYFYVESPDELPEVQEQSDMVFVGTSASGGFVGFWDPGTEVPASVYETGGSWLDRVEIGFDWRADISSAQDRNPRNVGKPASGVDRVGVRADFTALMRDGSLHDDGSSAWRVTGMLGSASLSLAPGNEMPAGVATDGSGNLLWDIGIGWSSGPVSLTAGYQSALTDSLAGEPVTSNVLSVGADYILVPGISVYGELNVVGEPTDSGEERLGTIFVLGTGLNF